MLEDPASLELEKVLDEPVGLELEETTGEEMAAVDPELEATVGELEVLELEGAR
jgi:hypothetical protein